MSDLNLATIRLMLGRDAFRSLVEKDASKEGSGAAYRDIQKALDRAKIPERVRWNYGKPVLPPQAESIFDFRNVGEYPHAYLAPFDQPTSARGVTGALKPALRPGALADLLEDAKAGAKQGRWAWYDMSPIHDFVRNEIDPADAEHAQRFMKLGVPLSQQTSVPAEILGSAYTNRLVREGGNEALTPNDESLGITRFGGGASPADKLLRAKRMLEGESLSPTSPKLRAYEANRAGNLYPATIDSKMLDLLGMDPKSKPTAKNDAAALIKSLGSRTGMEPAKLQASLWGEGRGSKTTGDASEPYAAVLNNMLYRAATKEGIDPKRYAVEVLSGMRDMPHTAKGLGYAGGGKVRAALEQLADRMELSLHVGNPELAASRLVDRPDAMKAYAARVAPSSWRDSIMSGSFPAEQSGSGRQIMFLDVPGSRGREKAILKLAKKGRGTAENQVAGDPKNADLVRGGNLPQPYFTAPEGDFVISPRMRTDPATLNAHASFMKPMVNRYQGLSNSASLRRVLGMPPDAKYYNLHHYDPELQDMLASRDMLPFADRELLGHDFWTYRGNKIEPGLGRMPFSDDRVQSTLSHPAMGKGFVLLDEGALLPHLLPMDRARMFDEPFQNITKRRIETLRDPETADLVDRNPQMALPPFQGGAQEALPPKSATDEFAEKLLTKMRGAGLADGGHLKRARLALAGGGVARNWLRGVPGSVFDEALSKLKERYPHNPGFDRPDAIPEIKAEQAKREALKRWIDTNLANYLVREHGTETDPLTSRNMTYGRMGFPAAIKKMTAGESLHVIAPDYARESPGKLSELKGRVPDWYYKLVEQDAPRHWSDMQREKLLNSTEWNEAVARANSRNGLVSEPGKEKVAEMQGDMKKYQRRNAEPVYLHDIHPQRWQDMYHPLFSDTLDYLGHRMGARPDGTVDLKPEQLSRMSVAEAVRGSKDWHDAMKKAAEKAALIKFEGPGYKSYPSGWKWLEMGGEKTEDADAELAQKIGKQLGHCYKDPETCKSYLQGSKLYSLLDPTGKAHATLEAGGGYWLSGDIMNDLTGDKKTFERWLEYSTDPNQWRALRSQSPDMHRWFEQNYPDAWAKFKAPSIRQVRGPENERVRDPEALGYVQDFIRSGKWGNIDSHEAQNAGLFTAPSASHPQLSPMYHKLMELYPGIAHYTEDELQNAAKLSGSEKVWSRAAEGRNYMYAKGGHVNENRKGNPLGRARAAFYSTDGGLEDATAATRERDFRWSHLQKHADGGAVSQNGFPMETSDERIYRAVLSLNVLKREYIEHPTPELNREIARTEALIRKLRSPQEALTKQAEDAKQEPSDPTTASRLANEATPDVEDEEGETLAYLLKLLQDGNPEGVAN